MTNLEAAYIAGLLEGEGCFDFNAGNPKYPRIRLEMSDIDVVTRVQTILECGKLHYPIRSNKNWKSTAVLTINGRKNVEPILLAVKPWLGDRRRTKVEELLAAYTA